MDGVRLTEGDLAEGHCEGEGCDDEPGGEEQVYPDQAVDVAVVGAE